MITRIVKCQRFDKLSVITDEFNQRYSNKTVSKRCLKLILHKNDIHNYARKESQSYFAKQKKVCSLIESSKRLAVQGDSKTMRVLRKKSKDDNAKCLCTKKSQIQFRSCSGNKGVGKLAVCNGNINSEKYFEILQDILLQGIISMLGKKRKHPFFNMTMHPFTRQFSLKFTCVSVKSVSSSLANTTIQL